MLARALKRPVPDQLQTKDQAHALMYEVKEHGSDGYRWILDSTWFRDALKAALSDEVEFNKQRNAQLRKRESELKGKQGRLLDAFLSGTVDKEAYAAKAEEIKAEIAKTEESLAEESKENGDFMQLAEAAFNLSQRAVETWQGSNWAIRRELLEILSSNRELDVASLAVTWNKPFDALAEQPDFKDGGRYRIRKHSDEKSDCGQSESTNYASPRS